MALFDILEVIASTVQALVSGTDIETEQIQIKEDNTALQCDIVKNSGTLAGTITLHGRAHESYEWVEVAGASQDLVDVAVAATDPHLWNVRGYGIPYLRVVIEPTDTANVNYKVAYSSKI